MAKSSHKRKASESVEPEEPENTESRGPVKKLSKKSQKLQEARQNARAWAEAQKEKQSATKSQPEPKPHMEELDDDHIAEPQPRKRMRVEESPGQKKTSSSKVKVAREAAKRWAEEDKANLEQKSISSGPASELKRAAVGKKSPARTTKSGTGHKKKTAPESAPVAGQAVVVPVTAASGVAADNAAMQAIYASSSAVPVPGGAPLMVQQPVAGGIPYGNGGFMFFVQGGSQSFPPPVNQAKDEDDTDDEVCPPPPLSGLEQQVSQIVLNNVEAASQNKPTSDCLTPDFHEAAKKAVGAEEFDETAGEEDDEPIMVDGVDESAQYAEIIELKKRADQATKWAVVFAVSAGLIYLIRMAMPPDVFFDNVINKKPLTPTCFFDSKTGWVDDCPDGNGVPCPYGGVCSGGKLVECLSPFKEVSASGDSCILNDQYKLLTAVLTKELENHARQHQSCDGTHVSTLKYTSVQQLHPDVIVEESPALKVMLREEGFAVATEDDGLHLGLPEDHKLELPIHCHFGNAFKWMLEATGSGMMRFVFSVWKVFLTLLGVFWNCAYAYPLASAIGFIAVFTLWTLKKWGDEKKKRTLDTANMRQMAYTTLQENPQSPHLVVHIRDEIAFCLAEFDKNERRHLIRDIWPKVVSDVKLDNRIRKSQRLVDGVPSDAWQWVAATTPKSARFASDTK